MFYPCLSHISLLGVTSVHTFELAVESDHVSVDDAIVVHVSVENVESVHVSVLNGVGVHSSPCIYPFAVTVPIPST